MKPGRKLKDRSGDGPDTRRCCTCHRSLPYEDFYRKSSRADGYTVECKECIRARMAKVYKRSPVRIQTATRKYRDKIRREALNHYGHACACCGETRYEFLAIDHHNGEGSGAFHKDISAGGRHKSLAVWLKLNNYPPGFRLLCHNCNCARSFYGYCPHETQAGVMRNAKIKPRSSRSVIRTS